MSQDQPTKAVALKGETIWLVPVAVPDGVSVRSVMGCREDVLYDLRIAGPIRPEAWYTGEINAHR